MVVVGIFLYWLKKVLFLLTLKTRLEKQKPNDFIPPQHILPFVVNLSTNALLDHPEQAQKIIELLDKERTPNLKYFKYYIDPEKKELDQLVQLDRATKMAVVNLKNRQDTNPVKLHLSCDLHVFTFLVSGQAPGHDILSDLSDAEHLDKKSKAQSMRPEDLPQPLVGCLSDLKVSVIGKLANYSSHDFNEVIKYTCGANVIENAGKNHNLVIAGDSPGPLKVAKVKALDAKVIDEEGFIQLMKNMSENKIRGKQQSKVLVSDCFLSLVNYLDIIIQSEDAMYHHTLYDVFKREIDFSALELLHLTFGDQNTFSRTLSFPLFLKKGAAFSSSLICRNATYSQQLIFVFKHIFSSVYRPKFVSCRDDQMFIDEQQENAEWMDCVAYAYKRFNPRYVSYLRFEEYCFPRLKYLYYEINRGEEAFKEKLLYFADTCIPNVERIWLTGCFRGEYRVFPALTKLTKLKEVHFFDAPVSQFGGFDEGFMPSNPLLDLLSNGNKLDLGEFFGRLDSFTIPLVKETNNFARLLLFIKSLPIQLNLQVSYTVEHEKYQDHSYPPFENLGEPEELAEVQKVFAKPTSFPLSCYAAFPELRICQEDTNFIATTWTVNSGFAKANS